MEITLSKTLPAYPSFVEGIRRAPDRGYTLDAGADGYGIEERLALHPQRAARNPCSGVHGRAAYTRTYLRLPLPPAGRPQSETHRRIQGELHRRQGIPGDD